MELYVELTRLYRGSMAATKARSARQRGEIETLPSGSLRLRVYAGIDPAIVDIVESLRARGIDHLVLVNAHVGNSFSRTSCRSGTSGIAHLRYFRRVRTGGMLAFAAGVETSNHDDMHAGEVETSILLAEHPETVGEKCKYADRLAEDRRLLMTIGVSAYANGGVIGRPSLVSEEKGRRLLEAFSGLFAVCHIEQQTTKQARLSDWRSEWSQL